LWDHAPDVGIPTKQREIGSDLNGEYSQTSATIAEKRAKVGKSMENVDPSWFLQHLSPELHDDFQSLDPD
jgi:hypothetical protein